MAHFFWGGNTFLFCRLLDQRAKLDLRSTKVLFQNSLTVGTVLPIYGSGIFQEQFFKFLKFKLRRGEICVTYFIPPANGAVTCRYFVTKANCQFEHFCNGKYSDPCVPKICLPFCVQIRLRSKDFPLFQCLNIYLVFKVIIL